jgi:arabinofuranosyltransferase
MNNILKYFFILSVVLLGAFYSWYTCGKSLIGIDDANIYFAYMRNFAEGKGFIFTNGGERVEGFTSLLWTLIGSFYYLFSKNIEILLFVTNIITLSFALYKLMNLLDQIFGFQQIISTNSILILGCLLLSPGYFEWTVLSLMETGLWSSLLILISVNLLKLFLNQNRSKIEYQVLIILLVLCRPESILWVSFFILIEFIYHKKSMNKKLTESLGLIKSSILTFIFSLLLLHAFRYYYFSFLFPNTFYAKVSLDFWYNVKQGLTYVRIGIENNPSFLISILLSIFVFIDLINKKLFFKNSNYLLIFGVQFLTCLIPLLTGGDHFGLSRFMVPTFPIAFLFIIFFINDNNFKLNFLATFVFLFFIVFVNKNTFYFNFKYQFSPIAFEWSLPIEGRENARKSNDFFKELKRYPTHGIHMAGGINYEYKGKSIDLLGLNNVEMAHADKVKERGLFKNHASFNKNIFYKQLPDLIWSDGKFIKSDTVFEKINIYPRHKIMYKQIYSDKKFKNKYSFVVISKNNYNEKLAILASNTFLNNLNKEIYTYKKIDFE